LTRALQAK